MVPHGDERQPSQNASDGHHVSNRVRLGLIQLHRPALARRPPPRGVAPAAQKICMVYTQFSRFALSLVVVFQVSTQFGPCLNNDPFGFDVV